MFVTIENRGLEILLSAEFDALNVVVCDYEQYPAKIIITKRLIKKNVNALRPIENVSLIRKLRDTVKWITWTAAF